MRNLIQSAIAEWLEEETKVTGFRNNRHHVEFSNAFSGHFTHARFCQQMAAKIIEIVADTYVPKFHDPSEYPKKVEGEDFSVDVFILDETRVHGIAFWNFDDKVWRFHTDTLVDYNEPNAETKWKWYYPPYDLNQVFNR